MVMVIMAVMNNFRFKHDNKLMKTKTFGKDMLYLYVKYIKKKTKVVIFLRRYTNASIHSEIISMLNSTNENSIMVSADDSH